jgi:tetratricopeptide (TPR) repeat protein
MLAATVLLAGATTVAQAQPTRTVNPNAPRLVVGTLRSSDKKLSINASEELRSRLASDIPFRLLTVISSSDYKTVVEQSGYPYDEALSTGDLASLAKLLRTDEFIEGTVEQKGPAQFVINASLVLTRDAGLMQPLPPAEGAKLSAAAGVLSKSVEDARKQLEFEKKCTSLGRENKPNEAIAAARQGNAAYPRATLTRLCELNVRAGYKQGPDSIIAAALEVLKVDPKNRMALGYAADNYKLKGDQDKSTEMLVQLLATDPTNAKLVDDVVNALAASGKPELAKPIISQAIKDNPGDIRLMKLAFLIYLAAKDFKNGTAIGEEMVKIDTSLADTTYFQKMVASYQADSNLVKASEFAMKGSDKFPNNVLLLGMLGSMQVKSGQQQQAIATFRKMLTVDPKAPQARMQIVRIFDDMKQPDSALATLRQAKAAGEDGQTVGQTALIIGNRFFKAGQEALNRAQQSKTSEDYAAAIAANKLVVPWVTFADSTVTGAESKNQAKFLLGVATFQIAVAAISDAPKNKSCELAKIAADNIAIAQVNLPAGGRFAPQVVSQLMPVVPQIMQGADMMVKGDPAKKIKGYCP